MEQPENDNVPTPMTVSAPAETTPEVTEKPRMQAESPAEIDPPTDPGYGFGV